MKSNANEFGLIKVEILKAERNLKIREKGRKIWQNLTNKFPGKFGK